MAKIDNNVLVLSNGRCFTTDEHGLSVLKSNVETSEQIAAEFKEAVALLEYHLQPKLPTTVGSTIKVYNEVRNVWVYAVRSGPGRWIQATSRGSILYDGDISYRKWELVNEVK